MELGDIADRKDVSSKGHHVYLVHCNRKKV